MASSDREEHALCDLFSSIPSARVDRIYVHVSLRGFRNSWIKRTIHCTEKLFEQRSMISSISINNVEM